MPARKRHKHPPVSYEGVPPFRAYDLTLPIPKEYAVNAIAFFRCGGGLVLRRTLHKDALALPHIKVEYPEEVRDCIDRFVDSYATSCVATVHDLATVLTSHNNPPRLYLATTIECDAQPEAIKRDPSFVRTDSPKSAYQLMRDEQQRVPHRSTAASLRLLQHFGVSI
ncbi:hypothetical protein KC930_00735 [Candidatus Saccharibacteria bacterium]|nr:hypothetical protein [Candidatus Saccharibacteria bacterium]